MSFFHTIIIYHTRLKSRLRVLGTVLRKHEPLGRGAVHAEGESKPKLTRKIRGFLGVLGFQGFAFNESFGVSGGALSMQLIVTTDMGNDFATTAATAIKQYWDGYCNGNERQRLGLQFCNCLLGSTWRRRRLQR